MNLVLDALARALGYMLLPRVMALSLLPLLLGALSAGLLGYWFWADAVATVRAALDGWAVTQTLLGWLDGMGLGALRGALAPLIVVALAVPVIVVTALLVVAAWLGPLVARLVRDRRFPGLLSRADEPWVLSVLRSAGLSAAALLAMLVSVPLWLVPPLGALIPPLIWGWLTAQVMASDVLTEHASRDERRRLLREHRWPLLAIGLVTGYLGAIPSLIWAFGAVTLVIAPLLIPVAVWLYMAVFVFAALWFGHYCLAALQQLRSVPPVAAASAAAALAVSAPMPLDPPA